MSAAIADRQKAGTVGPDEVWHVRAVAACNRFTASRLRCFATSFLFSTVVFVVAVLAFRVHGVNDDWAISNGLSGTWGDPQGLTLFVNALLCRAIVWLNTAIPRFNWFAVLEFGTAYLSYLAIVYFGLSRMRPPFAFVLIASLTLLVIPGCTYLANFTYVSGMACCAGGLIMLISLKGPKHKPLLVVLGMGFFFVGMLWRVNMFLVSVPVFGVAALIVAVSDGRAGSGVARSLARLWPFVLTLVALAGILAYHGSAWGDAAWDDWYQFNETRSVFSDYPHRGYGEVADGLAAAGVSENDYAMLCSWMTEDPDFFTQERISAIEDVATVRGLTPGKAVRTVYSYARNLAGDTELAVLVAIALLCCVSMLERRARRKALAMMALTAVMAYVFLLVGRLPDRVHYPLWSFTFAVLGCLASRDAGPGASAGRHVRRAGALDVLGNVSLMVSAVAVCMAAALVVSAAVPRWCADRVGTVAHADTFVPACPLADYMQDHADTVFVVNTNSASDIIAACYMIAPLDADLNSRMIALGGWPARSPYSMARNERAGMANPIKGLVDNESAVYVAGKLKSANMLRTYLREHYYPNATYEVVDKVPTRSGSGMLKIVKFSAGSDGRTG